MDGSWQGGHWGEPQQQWAQQAAPQHDQWQQPPHRAYDLGSQPAQQQYNWGVQETAPHQAYQPQNPGNYRQTNNQLSNPYATEQYQAQYAQHHAGPEFQAQGPPPQDLHHQGANFQGHYVPQPHQHPQHHVQFNHPVINAYPNLMGMPSNPHGHVQTRIGSPFKPKAKHLNKVWTSTTHASNQNQKRAPGTVIRGAAGTHKLTTLPVQSTAKAPANPVTTANSKPAPPAKSPMKPPPAAQKPGQPAKGAASPAPKKPAPAPAQVALKGPSAGATKTTPTTAAPTQPAATKQTASTGIHPSRVAALGSAAPTTAPPIQKPSAPTTMPPQPAAPKASTVGAPATIGQPPAAKETPPKVPGSVMRLLQAPPVRARPPSTPTQTTTAQPAARTPGSAPRPHPPTPSKQPAPPVTRPPAPAPTQQSKSTTPQKPPAAKPPTSTSAPTKPASVPATPPTPTPSSNIGPVLVDLPVAENLQREMAWAKALAEKETLPPMSLKASSEKLLADARKVQQRNQARATEIGEPPKKKQKTLAENRAVEGGKRKVEIARRGFEVFFVCHDAIVSRKKHGKKTWLTMDPSVLCIFRDPKLGNWFFFAGRGEGYQVYLRIESDLCCRLDTEQSGVVMFLVPKNSPEWAKVAEKRPNGGYSFSIRFPTANLPACFEFVRLFEIAAAEFRIRARDGFKTLGSPETNGPAAQGLVPVDSIPGVKPQEQPRAGPPTKQQPSRGQAVVAASDRQVLEEAQMQLAIKKVLVTSVAGRGVVDEALVLCARMELCLRKMERVQVASRGGALDAEVKDYLAAEAKELRADLVKTMAAVNAASAEGDMCVAAEELQRASKKRAHADCE